MGGQFLLLGASSAFATVATLVSGIILARLLSVEERGLVAVIVYWAGLAAALGSLSLPDAFIYGARASHKPLAGSISTMFVTASGLAFVTIVIAVSGVNSFGYRFAGVSVGFAATVVGLFIFINHINGAFISVERSILNFRRLAIERIAMPLCYSGLLLVAALTGMISVEVALIIFLVSRIPVMVHRLWRFRCFLLRPIDRSFAENSLRHGARFHTVTFVRFFNEQADNFVVNFQWAIANIGYFAVGYSAAGAAYSLISQALGMMSLPIAAKLRYEEVADHLAQSLRITLLLMVAMMIPIVILAPLLIPFVFGAKFAPAAEITQILAVAFLPGPLIAQTDATLRGRGFAKAAFRMQIVALFIFAVGWGVFGYHDIYSLGAMLVVSRVTALVSTLWFVRSDLGELRLRDCFLVRLSDVITVWNTLTEAFSRLRAYRSTKKTVPGDGEEKPF